MNIQFEFGLANSDYELSTRLQTIQDECETIYFDKKSTKVKDYD